MILSKVLGCKRVRKWGGVKVSEGAESWVVGILEILEMEWVMAVEEVREG